MKTSCDLSQELSWPDGSDEETECTVSFYGEKKTIIPIAPYLVHC